MRCAAATRAPPDWRATASGSSRHSSCRTTRSFDRAPRLVLSERMQHSYPKIVCDMVEGLFTVTNPIAKQGGGRTLWRGLRSSDIRLRDAAKDAWTALRTFG